MMKFQNLSDLLNSLDSPDSLPKLPEPIRKELERIRKLEAKGMIQQYTVVLDEKQLGNDLTVFVSVRLEHPKFGESFAAAASSHPNIAECYYIAGDVDYLLKIVTDSSRSLELIHQDIKGMPGVSWTKTLYVLATIKNDVSVLPEKVV